MKGVFMKTNRNNIIIISLAVVLLGMSIGYAALAQQLVINGTAGVGDAKWAIQFKSITKNDTLTTSGTNEVTPPSVSGVSATFDVSLDYPGAKIVYDIVVENAGTIDATFVETTGVDSANGAEPVDIQYTVQKIDDTIDLLKNTTDTYQVTIEWISTSDTVPTTTSKTATINLDYVQKTT